MGFYLLIQDAGPPSHLNVSHGKLVYPSRTNWKKRNPKKKTTRDIFQAVLYLLLSGGNFHVTRSLADSNPSGTVNSITWRKENHYNKLPSPVISAQFINLIRSHVYLIQLLSYFAVMSALQAGECLLLASRSDVIRCGPTAKTCVWWLSLKNGCFATRLYRNDS